MNRKLLIYLNYGLSGVAALLLMRLIWLAVSWMVAGGAPPIEESPPYSRKLARNPFTQEQSAYDAIDALLVLERKEPQLSLPDLRKALTFAGTNGRPDADIDHVRYHLQLKGDAQPNAVVAGEPAYLAYDGDATPPRYVWSSGNAPTRLWLKVQKSGEGITVDVQMRGLGDVVISEPAELATLNLKEQRAAGNSRERWMIGQWRVDGTLLARQRTRWYGRDLFLEEHGGDDFSDVLGKERLDFGEGGDLYSLWVGMGDCILWDGKRWQRADILSGESRRYPLLCLEKLSDKVMTFQLWDVDGRRKVTINLVRSTELWKPTILEKEFRFVGARTRTQSIVEVRGERMTLRPFDWLVLVDDGWKKLATAADIDAYVERRLVGPLFIFEGIEKQEGVQWMRGTLYNASRTQKHELMLGAGDKRKEAPPATSQQQPRAPSVVPNGFKPIAPPPPTGMTERESTREPAPGIRGAVPPGGDPGSVPLEEMPPEQEESGL